MFKKSMKKTTGTMIRRLAQLVEDLENLRVIEPKTVKIYLYDEEKIFVIIPKAKISDKVVDIVIKAFADEFSTKELYTTIDSTESLRFSINWN